MHCSFSLYIRGGSTGQITTGRIATGQNYLGQKRVTGQSGLAELDFVKSDLAIFSKGQKRMIGFCQFKEYKNSQNCQNCNGFG
jgi:hypothetical protein